MTGPRPMKLITLASALAIHFVIADFDINRCPVYQWSNNNVYIRVHTWKSMLVLIFLQPLPECHQRGVMRPLYISFDKSMQEKNYYNWMPYSIETNAQYDSYIVTRTKHRVKFYYGIGQKMIATEEFPSPKNIGGYEPRFKYLPDHKHFITDLILVATNIGCEPPKIQVCNSELINKTEFVFEVMRPIPTMGPPPKDPKTLEAIAAIVAEEESARRDDVIAWLSVATLGMFMLFGSTGSLFLYILARRAKGDESMRAPIR